VLMREGWAIALVAQNHLCDRVGWLSPFFVLLLADHARMAARDRCEETDPSPAKEVTEKDIDIGFERLVMGRSRFIHWKQRLDQHQEPEQSLLKKALAAIAKAPQGLSFAQLNARCAKIVPDTKERGQRLTWALRLLQDDGYLSPPNTEGRFQFRSFLLAEFWRRESTSQAK
jgi:hypothetical protein